MNDRGLLIIDGSRLFSSIHEIWRTNEKYRDKKLRISELSEALKRRWSVYTGAITRIVYYFKQRDDRLSRMLVIPETASPGQKDHWQIKECGESIQGVPDSELQKLSEQYRDHFTRAEKGLDIKLACDVLLLVSSGRASNIVFLVNDRDYIPLFEAIQYLGGNVYLTALDSKQTVQKGLANMCDRYLTLDDELDNIFGISAEKKPEEVLQQQPLEPEQVVTPLDDMPTETKGQELQSNP